MSSISHAKQTPDHPKTAIERLTEIAKGAEPTPAERAWLEKPISTEPAFRRVVVRRDSPAPSTIVARMDFREPEDSAEIYPGFMIGAARPSEPAIHPFPDNRDRLTHGYAVHVRWGMTARDGVVRTDSQKSRFVNLPCSTVPTIVSGDNRDVDGMTLAVWCE